MSALRIIDANANRAREALRVLEETARFALEDAALTEALKQLRHDLAASLGSIRGLETHRDVARDVGTGITTEAEGRRSSLADVVRAAAKRLQEALRVVEEYGKLVVPDLAARIEALRYRSYELERDLLDALPSTGAEQWSVCVLLTSDVCSPRGWDEVAASIIAAAPDCIQLREKSMGDDELLRRARRLVRDSAPTTRIIINDRPDIALLSGADGVHLGQGDLPCADVRRLVGPELIVGVSTSRLEEARQAREDGADYCGVGPMFQTRTKHKPDLAGPAYLRAFVAWGGLPHLAIGGITPSNVGSLVGAGCRGVAVSAAVCGADDPSAVVAQLRERLVPG